MIKLLSISDDEWSLKKFESRADNIRSFLDEHDIQGLELMHWQEEGTGEVPMDKVVGRHMLFWPNWLDFWRSDRRNLLKEFGSEQNWREYYNAESLEGFIAGRRGELADAAAMGVQYVVFHVSHVRMEECYSGRYALSDREIVDAFSDMLNEALRGIKGNFTVLFENHWFPGLRLTDGDLAMRLLDGIRWPEKGFVLDISHLINTGPVIENEPEAVRYMLNILNGLGGAKDFIQAIHLNSPVKRASAHNKKYDREGDFMDRLIAVMKHVGGMDPHGPFAHADIRRVIDAVKPEYLVYELKSESLEELQDAVRIQNDSLSEF